MNFNVKDKNGKEISLYIAPATNVECSLVPARLSVHLADGDYAVPAIQTEGTDQFMCSNSSSSAATPIYTYYGTTTSPTLHIQKNNTVYHCVRDVKWKIDNTFVFDPNGGKGSRIQKYIRGNIKGSTATVESSSDITLYLTQAQCGFTRDHFNFIGWLWNNSISRSFGQTITNADLNGTADPVIYAHWVEHTYTINFSANASDTTGSTSSVQLRYSQEHSLPACGFSRTGYTFSHWSTASSGGAAYSASQKISRLVGTDKGSITLYAIWTPVTYRITYDQAGGSGANNPTTYTIEKEIVPSSIPVRTGYTFTGWSPEKISKGSIGDRKFTATWQLTDYAITYNSNGGSGGGGPKVYHYTDKTATTPTVNPTRAGYTFTGWTPSNIPAGSIGAKTFTANWEVIRYNIDYNTNGGNLSGQSSSYTIEDTYTPPTPSKNGYTFTGWSPASIQKGSQGSKIFTANWTPTVYTISYSLNGGSLSGQRTTYTIESGSYSPPAPSRTGYQFAGWSPSTIPAKSTGNKTFTANWTANKYYILFEPNGGNGSSKKVAYTYDEVKAAESNIFSRANWRMTGWRCLENGVVYTLGHRILNLTSTHNATYHFDAQWAKVIRNPVIYTTNVNISYYGWTGWSSWSSYSNGSWGNRSRTRTRNWTGSIGVLVSGGTSDVEAIVTKIETDYGSWTGRTAIWSNPTWCNFNISGGSSDIDSINVRMYNISGTLVSSRNVSVNIDAYDYESDYKSQPSTSSG